MNLILHPNFTQVSGAESESSSQADNISTLYTLENLIQTLEEAANYLSAFSQQQTLGS
jgi:hypothetical protein